MPCIPSGHVKEMEIFIISMENTNNRFSNNYGVLMPAAT